MSLEGVAILRLDYRATSHALVFLSYTMEVSQPAKLENESVLDQPTMEAKAVSLAPAGTRLLVDTVLSPSRVHTLVLPTIVESVWSASSIELRNQGDWVPMRVCAEIVLILGVPSSDTNSLGELLRSSKVACLKIAIGPD